jgi:hypothetical protein
MSYSSLPSGFLFQERYEIQKALEKGSGGTVYLVKDICYNDSMKRTSDQVYNESQTSPQSLLDQLFDDELSCSKKDGQLCVLKLFEGDSEFNFFEREC